LRHLDADGMVRRFESSASLMLLGHGGSTPLEGPAA
jgi:hypothetical protein